LINKPIAPQATAQPLSWQWHTHGRQISEGGRQPQGVAGAGGSPLRETLKLDAADGALELGEAGIGTKTLMEPAKARRVLAPKYGLAGFAVVFEGPHGIPELLAGGGDHAAFTSGAEGFVLAEAPSGHIAETANGLAIDAGAMGLGAVFNYGEAVGAGSASNWGKGAMRERAGEEVR